jgi:hypothetical protein
MKRADEAALRTKLEEQQQSMMRDSKWITAEADE